MLACMIITEEMENKTKKKLKIDSLVTEIKELTNLVVGLLKNQSPISSTTFTPSTHCGP